MKLAEALQERSDLNRSIEQLKQRLCVNAIVQEKEKPAEDPKRLIKALEEDISRLEELIRRINRTNCETVCGGRTLTEMIAERDCLKIKISAYKELAHAASMTGQRARSTEIRLISTVDVAELQTKIDALSKELRLLDNEIQSANWTTELV
ncbi:MAG: DIP1984 family protein [Ruminococcus sp.]|nr:DIP1984 family protein [Ruminococcus sp.]